MPTVWENENTSLVCNKIKGKLKDLIKLKDMLYTLINVDKPSII